MSEAVPAIELPASVDALQARLAEARYFADVELATAIFLALRLGKPLLLEGEAGVGKTEVAKAVAALRGVPLLRLQCYEGLDQQSALYEWDYSRQLLHIRLLEAGAGDAPAQDLEGLERGLYQPRFLLRRPLLEALELSRQGTPPVLLIDELDRADEEFEAFLLELLSDFQISIPELGSPVRADVPPTVILTSNRTREVHDALRRRCLYCWVDYPDAGKELRILEAKAPGVNDSLRRRIVDFVQAVRTEDLYKRPGVAETIDWALALAALDTHELTPEVINPTLGALLKYHDDLALIRGERAERLLRLQD
ncbi:MAG: MoxR family ATPase [Acidobacteriota bacterium]